LYQQIINFIYRHPKSALRKIIRFGGFISYFNLVRCRRLMRNAASGLSPVRSFPDGLPVYFLTGRDYLYQTLFCIQSLVKASQTKFKFILIDDGTFNPEIIGTINKLVLGAEVVTKSIIENNLQQLLPAHSYPVLNYKRKVYPHLKKLTDIHSLEGPPWKLVLDSDMLFLKEPKALINWLERPDQPVYMLDSSESYGYSRKLMQYLCGMKTPELLNVGAIGLKSACINWSLLETWIKTLEEKEGGSYYLEQALTAMLVGDKPATILNADDYKVNPLTFPGKENEVLHHYVDLSKALYFKKAWRTIC